MRLALSILIRCAAVACLPWSNGVAATGTEPATVPPIDPAPCFAAAEAHDDDKVIAICGPLIDGEKTSRADRIKALIARQLARLIQHRRRHIDAGSIAQAGARSAP